MRALRSAPGRVHKAREIKSLKLNIVFKKNMDFIKIKNMIRENGDKVVFMENGEPEFVVMSFVEYEKLARLYLPEVKSAMRPKTNSRVNEPEVRDIDSDRIRETEFLTPIDTGPIRTASVMEYDRPMESDRGNLARMADVRLEDLPI